MWVHVNYFCHLCDHEHRQLRRELLLARAGGNVFSEKAHLNWALRFSGSWQHRVLFAFLGGKCQAGEQVLLSLKSLFIGLVKTRPPAVGSNGCGTWKQLSRHLQWNFRWSMRELHREMLNTKQVLAQDPSFQWHWLGKAAEKPTAAFLFRNNQCYLVGIKWRIMFFMSGSNKKQ